MIKDPANLVCGIDVVDAAHSVTKSCDVTGSACDAKVLFDISDCSGTSLYLGNRLGADDGGRVAHGWTSTARAKKIDVMNALTKVP